MPVPAEATPEPLLRITDLSVVYEGNSVPGPVGLTIEVHRGEVVLVLGPSGSGKSTLALTLNGLIPHDIPAHLTGTVEVAGIDTSAAETGALAEHVAMVFQDPDAQQVTGSLLDEVAFGPENLLMPVHTVLERSEWALRRVGLWQQRELNPDLLSGGGRQRLAIACALAMGSPLLVLDEPTANLDPQGAAEVYGTLRELLADGSRAAVLIEHNLDEAVPLATRVLVLDHTGRVAFDGTPEDVIGTHADALVSLGVWLPSATIAAIRLRDAGLPIQQLPLTAAGLRALLPPPAARAEERTAAPSPAVQAAAAAPIITVDGLTLTRGGREVLREVSFAVPRGSFTAVLGTNGAGKTSLVQAIAGIIPPPRGRVSIAGLDPARASARAIAAAVGFVFQNPEHQFVATTVFDELAFGLRRRGTPEAQVAERVADVLDRFGLAARADVHPYLLSGGQKRRLSVGTALMDAPAVLVLDEPTFGQDRERASELVAMLKDLAASGTTVLTVTHDLSLVADAATHAIALKDGVLMAAGAVHEIFADTAGRSAAGLVLPPLPRAVRAVAGYETVWDADDLVRIATGGGS